MIPHGRPLLDDLRAFDAAPFPPVPKRSIWQRIWHPVVFVFNAVAGSLLMGRGDG